MSVARVVESTSAKAALFALLSLTLETAPVSGQSTFATITGSVTDPAGAVVAGVTVEATHTATNYRYKTASNEAGQYTFSQLLPGLYRVHAQGTGFKEMVVGNIELSSREVRRIDLALELGTVTTAIEVQAGATLIETETARIGVVRTAEVLRDLPLGSRSVSNFVTLTPSVGRSIPGQGNSGQLRFGGSRNYAQSDAQVDGVSTSDHRKGGSDMSGYIESYEEVRIDMANNSAEFGAIGTVTMVSKSGTNQLHGSLFDYYVTPWFRARAPFALQRMAGVLHFPGGSVGGPVYLPEVYDGRDRTFFFFSLEAARGSASQDLLSPTVPLAAWRTGDFSALAPGTVVRDPFGGNAPFAGNRIPAARLNPVSARIQDKFYPLPNFGNTSVFTSQNYREQRSRPFDPTTYWTTRMDHRFSSRDWVSGRYTWNKSLSRSFSNLPVFGQNYRASWTTSSALSYTRNISPNMLNEFRFGFYTADSDRWGPMNGKALVTELGLQGLVSDLPDIQGSPAFSFTGLGITSVNQMNTRSPAFASASYYPQTHLKWFRGRHAVKIGFLAGHTRFQDRQMPGALFGSANFSNRFANFAYADFLLGIPTTSSRAFPALLQNQVRWIYQLYVADQFKITPRLTVDYGIRYEVTPPATSANGYQSVFDPASGKIVVPDGSGKLVSPLIPRNYVGIIEAKEAGLPNALLQTDRNNFAPRIGVAYRPWGNRTVFRAGYGVFYDTVTTWAEPGAVPFLVQEPSFNNPAGTPAIVLPTIFPASVAGPATISLPSAVRRDTLIPYSMQWNATVEHEYFKTGFRVSYVGTNSRQGVYARDINQPVADTRPYVDKPRPFPQYPAITGYTNGAGHEYHSLTLSAERRLAAGLFYQFGFVWARDIGDMDFQESGEDAFDRRRDRGVWADTPTRSVKSSLIYELPFGKGRRFGTGAGRVWNALFGGWQLSAIFISDSGPFLTPLWTGPDPTNTRFTPNRTAPNVTLRPDIRRNPNLPSGQRTTDRWFDASAFAPPAAGRFGSASRGALYGPDAKLLHVGLYKSFEVRERVKLRLEINSTNFPNHPNWSAPGLNISAAGQVGVITATGPGYLDESGPRSFRAGLRLQW